MIGVINLGNSNLMSLTNSLEYLDIDYKVISSPDEIETVERLILPGVGSFKSGMDRIRELGLYEAILNAVEQKNKPILGICLGMQLLFDSSEEDPGCNGLSLLPGDVIALPKSEEYGIPRIGWADSIINYDFLGLSESSELDFYYIHSFYVDPQDPSVVSISTGKGITAAVASNNVYGCQFHPEKSHINGLNILNAFSKI